MANLKEIRRRLRSVKNMQQITKAMKMVSAARLRRAQDRMIAARPYAALMTRVLRSLAKRAEGYSHPLLDPRGDENYLYVLVTADKGLCGAFNMNLIKAANSFVRKNADRSVRMIPVGRRGRDFFRRRDVAMPAEFVGIIGKQVTVANAQEIADAVLAAWNDESLAIDKVFLSYNQFRSVLSQSVVVDQLLPVGDFVEAHDDGADDSLVDYIYEQSPDQIFKRLLPTFIESQIFHALLESSAGEHGARMTAMDSASKNASDLIKRLTLHANRVRQASITNEIIEVVSGAQAH